MGSGAFLHEADFGDEVVDAICIGDKEVSFLLAQVLEGFLSRSIKANFPCEDVNVQSSFSNYFTESARSHSSGSLHLPQSILSV